LPGGAQINSFCKQNAGGASQRTLLGHRWVLFAQVATMLVGSLISDTLVERALHPAPDLDGPRTAVF